MRQMVLTCGLLVVATSCAEPTASVATNGDAYTVATDGRLFTPEDTAPLGPDASVDAEPAPVDPTPPLQAAVSIILIDTDGVVVDDQWDERPWVDIDLSLIEGSPDQPAAFDGPVTWQGRGALHVRGNSSTGYEKKQYALETRDAEGQDLDMSPFGMPEEEDWVLAGPYSDKTLMRNHLMFQWSRGIGRYAPRTHFVELYMEDGGDEMGPEDYRGVYVFTEKIKRDKHRVAVEKLTPDDDALPTLAGGYLLKHDWLSGEVISTDLYGDELVLEYPRAENLIDAQRDYIEGYLDGFEQALERGDGSHVEYADIDSFVDHMILVELSRNVDGYVLSTHIHKAREGRLAMGPIWDFNGALGNADYFDSWLIAGWHYENPEFPADNPNGFRWYEKLLEDPAYQQRLSERWSLHRADALSDVAMMADIDGAAALLDEAQARNFDRWPVLGERIWPNAGDAHDRQTFAEEVTYLKDWLTARAVWLDSQWLQ